ncbi:MAG: hypothetical protein CMQ46_13920 [Gammaproteobacteria bacterium]|nr:hypothetical protein [Gammaproteobacteria bacterium]MBJ56348.1 hypothetical protein [Gammaproteobacteria bacterium]
MRHNRGRFYRPMYFKGGSNRIEETADQKEFARIAAERWGNYQATFVPAENKYIEEMTDYDNPARMEGATRSARAAVQDSAADAWQERSSQMTRQAIDPSSGRFGAAVTDHAARTAGIETDVVNRTQQAVQDQRVQGMKNIVAMGNGQSAEALQGMGDVASRSAAEAADSALRKENRRSSTHQAIGTVAGAGTRAAIEYGGR